MSHTENIWMLEQCQREGSPGYGLGNGLSTFAYKAHKEEEKERQKKKEQEIKEEKTKNDFKGISCNIERYSRVGGLTKVFIRVNTPQGEVNINTFTDKLAEKCCILKGYPAGDEEDYMLRTEGYRMKIKKEYKQLYTIFSEKTPPKGLVRKIEQATSEILQKI